MGRIAEVLINITTKNIKKTFSYRLPDEFDFLSVGWRVLVPFGPRQLEGFIMNIADGDTAGLKSILDVLDSSVWFNENMLKTAEWISSYYLCTLAEAMRLFIPGKSGVKSQIYYRIHETAGASQVIANLSAKADSQRQLFEYLKCNGPISISRLKKQFGQTILPTLQQLLRKKLIAADYTATIKTRAKYKSVIELGIDDNDAAAAEEKLSGKPAQLRLFAALLEKKSLERSDLEQIKISPATVKALAQTGIAVIRQVQVMRNTYIEKQSAPTGKITLTAEQQHALSNINTAIKANQFYSFLLHGITGSGKTQVYIEAVAAVRRNNRQAIILVPEIALTSQIVFRFRNRFRDDVVVIHSKLSAGERADAWQRLHRRQAGIVIGARSAIFAPLSDIGIIIIDEEHEFTYKQEEAPRYHTLSVAITRAKLAGATVVLGSATPLVETYYNALQKKHTLLSMTNRISHSALPQVEVVDMREELRSGQRSVLSTPLKELLNETFSRKEQAIILLNRRGYSTFVLCRECGHVMRCPHCSTSLVYHASGNELRCHYCQWTEQAPDICPVCSSRYIRYFGTGTQKLEQDLRQQWPLIRMIRMDQDTTAKKMSHHKILDSFAKGNYDVLLGTQMVAKGHDIENVTAVGIISADTALNLPDFRAAERTFDLLTQAAGRAGRGEKPGRVVVQTYNPDHYAVQTGAKQDYLSFYQTEINYRHDLGYPPFGQLIKLTIVSSDESVSCRQAALTAEELKTLLADLPHTEVIGPFKAPIAKINDIYRMQLLIKSPVMDTVKVRLNNTDMISRPNIVIDVDPVNVM